MNKLVFLLAVTGFGTLAAWVRGPFVPLAIYYFYGVLRPQFLWKWDLIVYPDIGWSFYVAGSAIAAYVPWSLGVVGPRNDPERRTLVPFGWTHRFVVLFGVWICFSYGFANNQGVAYPYFEEYLKIFVIYLLATQVVRSFWQIRTLYLLMTCALGYIAIDVNQIYYESQYLLIYHQGYSGLDNNGAGLMLAMGIPLCYFAWEFTPKWYRWGFLLLIPLLIHAVVSSYSRGAMLSMGVVAPFYMLYTRKRLFLCGIFLGVVVLMPFMAGKEIQERFLSVEKAETDESFGSRMDSWGAAIRIANEFPVFGAGVRNSNLLSKQYGADLEGRTIHSTYLQIAGDNGWLGLLVYVSTLVTALGSIWMTRRRLWRNKDPEAVRMTALLGGVECSLWTFIIGGTALSLETFEMPYILTLLGAQTWMICNARMLPPPGVALRPPPANQVGMPTVRRPDAPPAGKPAAQSASLPIPTRASFAPPRGTSGS